MTLAFAYDTIRLQYNQSKGDNMFNKKQINAIIKMLKDSSIDRRPPLQQIFEQGGYMWATNGYVALELGEVKDELKGKRITLASLVGWSGTHKGKDTTNLTELVEDNEYSDPDVGEEMTDGDGDIWVRVE